MLECVASSEIQGRCRIVLVVVFSFEEDHVTGSLVLETMDNSNS